MIFKNHRSERGPQRRLFEEFKEEIQGKNLGVPTLMS